MTSQIANEVLPEAGRGKNAAGQGLFTPCTAVNSLLITSPAAAKNAVRSGGAVLLSPACFSFGQFPNVSHLAESYLRNDNFNGRDFLEENFPAQNEPDQPTTNTSKKGRPAR
jgi:hypothetical protein